MKKTLLLLASAFLLSMNASAVKHIITVQNIVFTPSTLTINLGDTVEWMWINGTHTTTSLTIPAGAASWNVNMNSTSQTFIYVPAVTGVYNYQCNFHFSMGMTGTITVNCPAATVHISAGSATTFCKGGSVTLSSSTTGGVTSYQWNLMMMPISGQTNPTLNAAASGSYTLKATNACGSSMTSNAIMVKVNPLPMAKITPAGSVNLCSGKDTLLTANSGTNLTYQWIRNGVSISGATNKTFNAHMAGSYKVMVTNSSTGCTKTSPITKIVTVHCLSVLSVALTDEMKIYPDPVDATLTFTMTNSSRGTLQISIYNELGQKVKSLALSKNDDFIQHDIDMSGVSSGIYLVIVNAGDGQVVQKFMKK